MKNDDFKNMTESDKQQQEQDMKNGYRVAIGYYNKSLLALKMLFDDTKLGCISD